MRITKTYNRRDQLYMLKRLRLRRQTGHAVCACGRLFWQGSNGATLFTCQRCIEKLKAKGSVRFVIWKDEESDQQISDSVPVEITLTKEKPVVEFKRSGPTEEGSFFNYQRYELWDETTVKHEHSSGGVDCDGPISHDMTFYCAVDELGADLGWPCWDKKKHVVTDVCAQMAGY